MNAPLATLRQRCLGRVSVAALGGEVDLSNAACLEERIIGRAAGTAHVVVDLSGVSYLDSAGVRLLDSLRRHTHAAGGRTVLVAPRGSIARATIEVAGLGDALPLASSVPEAIASLDGGRT